MFVKLFSSILDSTVWQAPSATRVVWIALLAMADSEGCVFASVPGLARRAGVTREECETALAAFMGPDPDSRTRDHEGRRIEEFDGGWRLLNYSKYREIRTEEERREYKRLWAANKRRDSKGTSGVSTDVDRRGQVSTKSTDQRRSDQIRSEKRRSGGKTAAPSRLVASAPETETTVAFLGVYDAYPNRNGKIAAARVWRDLAADYAGGEAAMSTSILLAFKNGFLKRHPYDGQPRFVPTLKTFLAERRWEEPVAAGTANGSSSRFTRSEMPEGSS